MAEKIEINENSYKQLINKVYENKLEERELALDRYRSAEEHMETPEQFVLMGKNAVAFLNVAAGSTNDLAALAKELKSLVYKGDTPTDVNVNLDSNWKTNISEFLNEKDREAQDKSKEQTEKE